MTSVHGLKHRYSKQWRKSMALSTKHVPSTCTINNDVSSRHQRSVWESGRFVREQIKCCAASFYFHTGQNHYVIEINLATGEKTERGGERETHTHRDKDRERDRQTDRERETERQRRRQREITEKRVRIFLTGLLVVLILPRWWASVSSLTVTRHWRG